jgi:hypothetical protein
MLVPRASNAFVCIRCELQLARRRLPAYARRPSRANFSTSARRRDGAEDPDALSPPPPPPSALKITREREPLNRITRRQGRAVRETSARLGVKALGDDAEILVLSDLSSRHSEEHAAKPRKFEPLPAPDITAILDTQKEDVTPQDIRDRIESLRPLLDVPLPLEPGEPHYISQKDFVTLIRDLSRGFTQPQLAQYYAAVKNVQQEGFYKEMLASMKEETGTTKREILRSNWQPGITPITKRLPGMAMATGPKRAPINKSLLVDRIMRDVWKLVPLEEVEARGEVELFLKPWQIAMLNAGGVWLSILLPGFANRCRGRHVFQNAQRNSQGQDRSSPAALCRTHHSRQDDSRVHCRRCGEGDCQFPCHQVATEPLEALCSRGQGAERPGLGYFVHARTA